MDTSGTAGLVREVCLGLPEVNERLSHGAPTFFVRGKRSFVVLWLEGHHDDDFPHLWCAAPEGAQAQVVEDQPRQFFRPPYVGHRGWLGVRLDRDIPSDELVDLCEQAYRVVASATLLRRLDPKNLG
ncbi:MAG: MmcQ/YjbR family DNA-binding protein [Propionibacteriales bacterium]|nr:MmcQ/YjbR family DNA-binding protein [Propionibacteriales bacterium]